MSVIETITVADETIPGLSYRVVITPDEDTCPEEFDCYGERDIDAYHNADWQYVGVIVTPIISGFELDMANASLWATEYGTMGNGVEITADKLVKEYPGPDLMQEARDCLAKQLGPVVTALTSVQENL